MVKWALKVEKALRTDTCTIGKAAYKCVWLLRLSHLDPNTQLNISAIDNDQQIGMAISIKLYL